MADLVPIRPSTPLTPSEIVLAQRPAEAVRAFAELVALLETRLATCPDDYESLVALGEMKLRAGMVFDARRLLQHATMLQPPSWHAYQRTSAMLRIAEHRAADAFPRISGAGLPGGAVLLGRLRRFWPSRALRGNE